MKILRDVVSAIGANLSSSALIRRLRPQNAGDGLEPSVYGFILRYSWREQIYVVVMTLASFPFLYWSLDLPKQIVNRAISGKHFPQPYFGLELNQIPYLVALCVVFLALILINGWFKLHINVRKGVLGERMLRRLRYELYQRVLRFPLHHFDRVAQGQIVAMITAELEPVGGFVGEAFAVPISQAGTLLTILVFMFMQNPALGTAALALYPLQGYLIPKCSASSALWAALGYARSAACPIGSARPSPPGSRFAPMTAPIISSPKSASGLARSTTSVWRCITESSLSSSSTICSVI